MQKNLFFFLKKTKKAADFYRFVFVLGLLFLPLPTEASQFSYQMDSSSSFFLLSSFGEPFLFFTNVLLRLVRVIAMLFLLLFIQSIIVGAITHMTSRGKDEQITKGRRHMVRGAVGTLMMMLLFLVTTVAV